MVAQALAAFTQLRALSLVYSAVSPAYFADGTANKELLSVVPKLPQVTGLCFEDMRHREYPDVSDLAASFAAAAARTELHRLQMRLVSDDAIPDSIAVFGPGAVYPHLRIIDLRHMSA